MPTSKNLVDSHAEGTIGALLVAGGLNGLTVPGLRVDTVTLEADGRRHAIHLTATAGARQLSGKTNVEPGRNALSFARGPLDRVHAALTAFAASGEGNGTIFLDRVLDALLPEIPATSFAGWVRDRMVAVATEGGTLAREGNAQINWEPVRIDGRFRGAYAVSVPALLVLFRGDAVVDIRSGEIPMGNLEPADLVAPAPADDHPMVRAAVARYRAVWVASLRRSAEIVATLLPADLAPRVALHSVIRTWCADGEPPPRPNALPLTEERLAALTASFQRIKGSALTALRKIDRQIAAAYALGAWQVLFCPDLRPASGTGHDKILLRVGNEAPAVILMGDPTYGVRHSVDGDARTMRGVLDFLRALIARTKADVRLTFVLDEDDSDAEPEHRMLTDWMRFGDPVESIDWRLEGESTVEGVPLSQAGYARNADEQRAHEGGTALYQRFVRDLRDGRS